MLEKIIALVQDGKTVQQPFCADTLSPHMEDQTRNAIAVFLRSNASDDPRDRAKPFIRVFRGWFRLNTDPHS